MKILVIQQKMIGDVLVSTLICENLRKAYPNAQIDYMVYKSTMPVLAGHKEIDNIILFTNKHRKSKIQFIKLIRQIRKTRYHLIIDAYSKLESFLPVFFSKAKQKISYKKTGRNFLFTHNIPLINKPKTNIGLTIERRLSLLKPLNLNIDYHVVPKLFVNNEEKKLAKDIFKANNLDESRKTIMLSIIGSAENKTYPLAYMAKIIDFIALNFNANLLFNYIPNQIKQAEQVYNYCKDETKKNIYFNVLGKNLREFIAIMNACDFIIGNDSGSINMAKALGKPSFIIFSPWIHKNMWATFEDGIMHDSVHLNDFEPDLYKNITDKELRKNALKLYLLFKPAYIFSKLGLFLENRKLNRQVATDFNKMYNKSI